MGYYSNDLLVRISKLIERTQSDPHLELEARLGRYVVSEDGRRCRFQPGISQEQFTHVFATLVQYHGWKDVVRNEQSVDWRFANGVRHQKSRRLRDRASDETGEETSDENNDRTIPMIESSETMRKQKIKEINVALSFTDKAQSEEGEGEGEGEPMMAVRIRLSREEPIEGPCTQLVSELCQNVRLKMRESFCDDRFRYDLTRVSSGSSVEEACRRKHDNGVETYEVELEYCPSTHTPHVDEESEKEKEEEEEKKEENAKENGQQNQVNNNAMKAKEMIHKILQLVGVLYADKRTIGPIQMTIV